MRVFLVMLMLSLLPLQFSAAAADACCSPSAPVRELQASHHLTAHASPVAAKDDVAANTAAFDLDCGMCHANCAAACTGSFTPLFESAGSEQVRHLEERHDTLWHGRPYRPQWPTPNGSGLSAFA